jgi:hypothetical protein
MLEPGHDPLERFTHQEGVLADHEANAFSGLSAPVGGLGRQMRHGGLGFYGSSPPWPP